MKLFPKRYFFSLILLIFVSGAMSAPPVVAQTPEPARAETGGAQTLEDILARQAGQKIDDAFRRDQIGDPENSTGLTNQLGTLGAASDAEVYRAFRYGSADITSSSGDPVANVVIQDSGMKWLKFRAGPMRTFGAYSLLGILVILLVFFLLRGKIRIEGGRSGALIERFTALERFGHWMLAGSFIVLALTGLASLFGRVALIPLIGKDAFAAYAIVGKWLHNNVAWAFIAGLIWVFLTWVAHNLPARHDVTWLLKGGGLFSRGSHPPAKKFNAGQKIIFWSVILLGGSISLSGISLLFPFELPLFAKSFAVLNLVGLDFPTTLLPHEEMQLAQLWHAGVSFVLTAIVIAHIYLGSIGMEGAYDAMSSGHVDRQWAKEHHSLWVEEMETGEKASADAPKPTPAE